MKMARKMVSATSASCARKTKSHNQILVVDAPTKFVFLLYKSSLTQLFVTSNIEKRFTALTKRIFNKETHRIKNQALS